jgi:hypothetical protein
MASEEKNRSCSFASAPGSPDLTKHFAAREPHGETR